MFGSFIRLCLFLAIVGIAILLGGVKSPLIGLIIPAICMVLGFLLGYYGNLVAESTRKLLWRIRDTFLYASIAGGYSLMLYSYIFSSPHVTWEAFFAGIIALQSQLALIYYRLGEIRGTLGKVGHKNSF
jgi:hypothetical protein